MYHARDFVLTERLDYFGAALTLVFGIYYSIIRILQVKSVRAQKFIALPFFLAYIFHIIKLSSNFDYKYNMIFCVIVGLSFQIVWIAWYIFHRDRWYARKALVFVIGAVASSSLEILDFEPILDIFDAHSLWHACTIPLQFLWYSFLVDDARYEMKVLSSRK